MILEQFFRTKVELIKEFNLFLFTEYYLVILMMSISNIQVLVEPQHQRKHNKYI